MMSLRHAIGLSLSTLLGLIMATGALAALPQIPPDAELESAGAVFGDVIIANENIFDLEDP